MDRIEENLGKYPYVTLAQVKDYLTIASNTYDGKISNIISYATATIEHYIGHPVLANTYTETFDGGDSAVYVSVLPLNNVYQVTEYNGSDRVILADTTTTGLPVKTDSTALTLSYQADAKNTQKIKKFGKSSLKLTGADWVGSATVPETLQFEEQDFTIETFVRVDEATLQDNVIFAINTDDANYMEFRLSNQYGLSFEANIAGSVTTVNGANTDVESQQFVKRGWAHVAVCRDLANEKIRLFYNGNIVADAAFAESNLTFTSNVEIGINTRGTLPKTLKGYLDDFRISTKSRYSADFIAPSNRFRPDDDTVVLIHWDGSEGSTSASDVHSAEAQYSYSKTTGRVTRELGSGNVGEGYPSLNVLGPARQFTPFAQGVQVEYRGGYESTDVPYDLQMATLDMIKLIYKSEQDRKGFSFEGESEDNHALTNKIPPHIGRILDLYRVI